MPRYFFHSEDGESYLDESGTVLEDLRAARDAALRLLGEMIRDDPHFWVTGRFSIIVKDEEENLLFSLHTTAVDGATSAVAAG